MNRIAAIVAGVALTLSGLSGCTAEPPRRGVVPTGGPPVIVPGEPGQPARTATPGQSLGAERAPNAADVRFTEAMIDHHRQALVMAALVPSRTASGQVRALAARMSAAQEAEITWMTVWLGTLGRSAPHGHGHDTSGLRAAQGRDFDRLFLEQMIVHHQAALTMAADVLRTGSDRAVWRLASDIDTGQAVEIDRMRALLTQTSPPPP